MIDPLFEPIRINQMPVKNRIYMPAMHLAMADDFRVTDPIVDFYKERAEGGAGLICVGFATVDAFSGNSQNIGAHDDQFIPGLARLASAIRDGGARSAVQLNHAGRYNLSYFLNGQPPVAPSAIASRLTRETPKALTEKEIGRTVTAFAEAADRVRRAGFDAVEILAGTGYLISEFLSPLTNQRTDRYGGSLENRMRFGLEVVGAVRQVLGSEYPLLIRMNGNDFMPGGQGAEALGQWAEALAGSGVDALCINVGWHEARVPQIVSTVPRGAFAYLARGIRERVSIPVIASHRINDPALARELIADGQCDMVAMGRALIADPRLPEKAREKREAEIVHCIACAQGCFDHLFELKYVECLCNPWAGHEGERPKAKSTTPKKVLVAGGGPAGMSAALAAHEKGHLPVLLEASHRLGGQLHLAAAPSGREEFLNLSKDLAYQVQLRNIPVRLGTLVTGEVLASEKPDIVVVATGGRPVMPPIPGIELPHVVQAWDVLSGKVFCGPRVAVVGGGAVGVETALFLAQKGTLSGETLKFLLINRAESLETLQRLTIRGTKTVTIVEMLDKEGKDIGRSTRWGMLQDLSRFGVTTLTRTRALEITREGLRVEEDGKERVLPVDTVVLAVGTRPEDTLVTLLETEGIPFVVVGDALKVGTAFDAVHQGHRAGLGIE